MLYWIYPLLALVVFLLVLNGFLKGAWQAKIKVVLGLILIALLISASFVGGWAGMLTFVFAFFSAIIARPFAARLASRLLAGSADKEGHYAGLPPERLQFISQLLGEPIDAARFHETLGNSTDIRDEAKNALFDYCEQQPSTKAILDEFNVSRKELEELYYKLLAAGAGQWACGHWVVASALAYPETLRYLLSRRGQREMETAYRLIMYFERGSTLPD